MIPTMIRHLHVILILGVLLVLGLAWYGEMTEAYESTSSNLTLP